jgi:uncharacterized membrane protein
MSHSRNFFSKYQIRQIESAIQSAEKNTSGEIRVHVEDHCKGEVLNYATTVFHKLKMHRTKLRNGVLFYLAVKDRKFAVIGDEGIHKCVSVGFWNKVRDTMEELFLQGKFTEGLCAGIEMTGIELMKYFPISDADKNELPNELTFGQQ